MTVAAAPRCDGCSDAAAYTLDVGRTELLRLCPPCLFCRFDEADR